VPLFGAVHLFLLLSIGVIAALLAVACSRGLIAFRITRLIFGYGLALNEVIWWIFRYSHEGFRFPNNLPLQLCDVTVWTTVAACLTLWPRLVEFSYFAGLAGAGMALLSPDLWSPWPSYPAVYFFLAHGGIVIAMVMLVFGGIARLKPGAVWRAFALLIVYAALIGIFDAISGANYMYLRAKPKAVTLLNALGPWPIYIVVALPFALLLFWILWVPARRSAKAEHVQDCA